MLGRSRRCGDDLRNTKPLAGSASTRICRSPRRIAPLKHVPEKSGMRSGFAAKPMRHLFTWASSLRQNRKGIPICMRTCFCRTMRREQRGQPVGWPIFNVYQPSGCPRAAIFQATARTLTQIAMHDPEFCVGSASREDGDLSGMKNSGIRCSARHPAHQPAASHDFGPCASQQTGGADRSP